MLPVSIHSVLVVTIQVYFHSASRSSTELSPTQLFVHRAVQTLCHTPSLTHSLSSPATGTRSAINQRLLAPRWFSLPQRHVHCTVIAHSILSSFGHLILGAIYLFIDFHPFSNCSFFLSLAFSLAIRLHARMPVHTFL